jgi:hypothetical protein
MKKTLLTLGLIFSVLISYGQTIKTNTSKTIWKKMFDASQKLEQYNERYVFTYRDEQFRQLVEHDYIWFETKEEMETFFLKLKEMMELPAPTGDDTYTLKIAGVSMNRGKNMLGIPFVYVFDGNSYFTWDPTRNNVVLKNISTKVN